MKNKKVNLETEKLRENLLRSISHDLRISLTGILGSVTTIIDNNDSLNNQIRKELIQNIFEYTSWLIHYYRIFLELLE